MSDINLEGAYRREDDKNRPISPKSSLSESEASVDKIASEQLGLEKEVSSAKILVKKQLPPPSPESEKKYQHPELAAQAVHSVQGEKEYEIPVASSNTLQAKWANPLFSEMMSTNQKAMERVGAARQEIAKTKEMYKGLQKGKEPTKMQKEVSQLLARGGTINSVEGGTGGVYSLKDREGRARYIIKPGDEAMLAINNGKGKASPFLSGEGLFLKEGVEPNQLTRNEDLAFQAAEIFGLAHITPRTEIMIIKSEQFHDILDGTVEASSEEAKEMAKLTPTDREKVCSVQEFIPDCWDIGAYLASQAQVEASEIKQLLKENPDAFDELERRYTPRDIDQERFEEIAIFEFLVGEKDGNAGNFLCPKEKASDESPRTLYKIDNACTFPDNNKDLRSGLQWIPHNYELPITPHAQKIVQDIDEGKVEKVIDLMKERGKSAESIEAFKKRVEYLRQYVEVVASIAELDTAFDYIEEEEGM